ncbi:MAG: arginase [Anaerolineae bacterium]|nr:arginase [Anaerolineae bacterium]
MTASKPIRIYGIPMDLGQLRRGVDMGPSAIRYAGLYDKLRRLGYTPIDAGNIVVPQVEQVGMAFDPAINARYLPQVTQVCCDTYDLIRSTLNEGDYAIFLGGDHSMSIGTVSAVSQMGKVGVLWVDAHADMNTPRTSPSGNIHGMSVAALLGDGPDPLISIGGPAPKLQPRDVAMVGLRNLDHEEKQRVSQVGVLPFTMRDIDEQGMSSVARQILDWFSDYDYLHISLDLDGCDPSFAPGVGTPVNGGLTYREAHLLMEILHDSGKVRTLDVVEVNPVLDERNRTADVAVDLVASLFGQQII